jgi:uncharacterized protein with NRDE domain
MCLLALVYRMAEDAPVVVGANREEYYHRGGEPPRLFAGRPGFVAGVDPTAGGTWLGVNGEGLLVAVTNRLKSRLPPTPRSRGLLVRELLGYSSAAAAVEAASRALDSGDYAGCNLLCADARDAVVIHSGDWLRVRPLPPGVHVLANRDVDDPTDHRVGYALGRLLATRLATAADAVAALRLLCASREPADSPVCFRHAEGGTVSSSILALRPDLADSIYLHAQGPPDRTPYADCSHLLRELAELDRGR